MTIDRIAAERWVAENSEPEIWFRVTGFRGVKHCSRLASLLRGWRGGRFKIPGLGYPPKGVGMREAGLTLDLWVNGTPAEVRAIVEWLERGGLTTDAVIFEVDE